MGETLPKKSNYEVLRGGKYVDERDKALVETGQKIVHEGGKKRIPSANSNKNNGAVYVMSKK